MSKIQLARRAVRLYSAPWAPLHTNKHNRRSWLRSVEMLGSKWLLATKVQRGDAGQSVSSLTF